MRVEFTGWMNVAVSASLPAPAILDASLSGGI